MTNFPLPVEYVFHDLNDTKNNQMDSEKRGFCALSELVYFKTQRLELVEVFHGNAKIT